jgi:enoyl-CoA hydratase
MPESGVATLTSVAGLDVALSEGVLSVTIDRPGSLNSVTTPVLAGIAVSLALACDLVLASDKAFFMLAFTQVGLMPDGGASALIAAAIGRIRAMRMALLAERLPASEALSAGLVTAVYPAEEFDAEVDKVVSKLLGGPVVAYAKTEDAINASTLTELDNTLEREFRGQSLLLRSHDFIEGATAFQQRRTPNFTDR